MLSYAMSAIEQILDTLHYTLKITKIIFKNIFKYKNIVSFTQFMPPEIGKHGHPCPRTTVSPFCGHGHRFLCGHGRGHDHLLFQKVLFMGNKVLMSLQLCQGDFNLIMQKDTI